MTRVSENSSYHAIHYSVGKSKTRLEDLQIKGANLKRIQKPSDDPVGNTELLAVRSKNIDAEQYLRNSNFAKTQINFTENAIEELTNIVVKAKELAIGQASNFYSPEVRQSIAQEVHQLRNQALSISNRRLGNRYIFSGHKTLTRPFDESGKYHGDAQTTTVEINKDFFIPINFSGKHIFFEKENTALKEIAPLAGTPFETGLKISPNGEPINAPTQEAEDNVPRRDLASESASTQNPTQSNLTKGASRTSIFRDLEKLENALLSNNPEIIQSTLPEFDKHFNRLVEIRSKIGSISNSIENAEEDIEKTKLVNNEYKSRIEDADVAKLFTDLSRQQNVMNATYKTSAQLMNRSLLDFIR